jgi:hypothetical protein
VANRKPIVALSDLTHRSDAALHFAGRLAHMLSAELEVVHALGLRFQPLRVAAPVLHNFDARVRVLDNELRAQVQRVVARTVRVADPIIDSDDAVRALQHRAEEVDPMVVVTPALWDWGDGSRRHPNFAATFGRLRVPALIIREPRRDTYNRVLVVSHRDSFNGETVEAAGRWGFWLEAAYNRAGPNRGPDFDVVLLDDPSNLLSMSERLNQPGVDLVAVDAAVLKHTGIGGTLDFVMPIILRQTVAPVALLSAAA